MRENDRPTWAYLDSERARVRREALGDARSVVESALACDCGSEGDPYGHDLDCSSKGRWKALEAIDDLFDTPTKEADNA